MEPIIVCEHRWRNRQDCTYCSKKDPAFEELTLRIAEFEKRESLAIEALCKIATGSVLDGWADDKFHWELCRSQAKTVLDELGVKIS